MITAILLAAGQSKRLRGENKLTKLFKGKPLINHILFSLIKSKVNKIIIVLGFEHLKVKTKLLKSKKINFELLFLKKYWEKKDILLYQKTLFVLLLRSFNYKIT